MISRDARLFTKPHQRFWYSSSDASYLVGASDEAAARSWLTEIRVSQLKLLLATFDEVRIGDGSARCPYRPAQKARIKA